MEEINEQIDFMSNIFKILGDKTRLKIVMSLLNKSSCVCELSNSLQLSQSLVSHQLKILRDNKIVRTERNKNHINYSLADEHITTLISVAKEHVTEL